MTVAPKNEVKKDQREDKDEIRVLFDTIPIQYAVVSVLIVSFLMAAAAILGTLVAYFLQVEYYEYLPDTLSFHAFYVFFIMLAFTALDKKAGGRIARLVPFFFTQAVVVAILYPIGLLLSFIESLNGRRIGFSDDDDDALIGLMLIGFSVMWTIQWSCVYVTYTYMKAIYYSKDNQVKRAVEEANRYIAMGLAIDSEGKPAFKNQVDVIV